MNSPAHSRHPDERKILQGFTSEPELLRSTMPRLGLFVRAYLRILGVARSIAGFESSPAIEESLLSKAIQYRTLDRNLWM